MNLQATLIRVHYSKDADGFGQTSRDEVLAHVRAYKEDRHGSVRWANRAAFSEATALFRFRMIPGIAVEPLYIIVCGLKRFEVLSVEVLRGMYYEILCREVEPVGKHKMPTT